MSRYIKLDDMRAIFCQSNSLTQAWNGFDRLPSIDIVRCKECVEYDDEWCMYWQNVVDAYDFCSYGERREP